MYSICHHTLRSRKRIGVTGTISLGPDFSLLSRFARTAPREETGKSASSRGERADVCPVRAWRRTTVHAGREAASPPRSRRRLCDIAGILRSHGLGLPCSGSQRRNGPPQAAATPNVRKSRSDETYRDVCRSLADLEQGGIHGRTNCASAPVAWCAASPGDWCRSRPVGSCGALNEPAPDPLTLAPASIILKLSVADLQSAIATDVSSAR